MRLSPAGLALLKQSEGFRSRTYRDVNGLATIGYGHRLLAGESYPEGIDENEAAELLLRDVLTAEQAVTRLVKVRLTQGQFDALVDFVFNLGAGRLAESTLLRELNAGHYAEAAAQLVRWDRAAGVELPSIKARRLAEVALWNGSAQPSAA